MRLPADAETNKQSEEDANGTRGGVHQCSVLGVLSWSFLVVVSDGADQFHGEGSNDATRYRHQHDRQDHQPDLRVQYSVNDLLEAKLRASDSRLVDADVLEKCNLFRHSHPLGLHGGVWHKQDD